MSNEITAGKLIVVEGTDYSGKSTFAKRLVSELLYMERSTTYTFQPGGCPEMQPLREIHLDRPLNPNTHASLMMADRYHHISEHIIPALESGMNVVCDRWTLSTDVYQAEADLASRNAHRALVEKMVTVDAFIHIRPTLSQIVTRKKERTDKLDHLDDICESKILTRLSAYDSLAADMVRAGKTVITIHSKDVDDMVQDALGEMEKLGIFNNDEKD